MATKEERLAILQAMKPEPPEVSATLLEQLSAGLDWAGESELKWLLNDIDRVANRAKNIFEPIRISGGRT